MDFANMATAARLYIEADLFPAAEITLADDQSHYLMHVLRLQPGAELRVFNGRQGEFRASLERPSKTRLLARIGEQTRVYAAPPDIWLVFVPIRQSRQDFLIEKATELGAAAFLPVVSQHAQVRQINPGRLQSQIREAAEQCERLDLPRLHPLEGLPHLLAGWPPERRLFACIERSNSAPLAAFAATAGNGPRAVLVGPEGGFSPVETDLLRATAFVRPVSLGPRILRAETAAIAALALLSLGVADS